MNNDVYSKKMENLGGRIGVRPLSNKKEYLKQTKIFDIDLVTIHKSKVTLKLKKLSYLGMCILDLSKMLLQE